MRGLNDKVAIVTGGASGIGAATAIRLREEGAQVVIADLNADAGTELAAKIGAVFQLTDVADEESIATLVDECLARFGKLDVFFANAGVFGAIGPIASTNTQELDATLAVNLRGAILCGKHAARVMLPRRSGRIIFTASPGAVIGGAGPHIYAATKGGVISFARSIAAELRSAGILVTSVLPGSIVSAMTADAILGDPSALEEASSKMRSSSKVGGPGMPEDIASAVAFLASDDAGYISGTELYVDAGYTFASGAAAFATDEHKNKPALFENGRRGI